MLRRFGVVAICIFLLYVFVGVAAASDQEDINALLDRFEKAIENDDISAVEKCLFKDGFLQIYDYSGRGVRTFKLAEMLDPDWFRSNRYVKFENRQINLEGNIAYVKCMENSLHHTGSNPHYRDLIIVIKKNGKWFISLLSGRQLDF